VSVAVTETDKSPDESREEKNTQQEREVKGLFEDRKRGKEERKKTYKE